MATLTPEVLAEIEALLDEKEGREGWFTTSDLMDAMGCSQGQARDALRELLKLGRLDTGRVTLGLEDGYLRRTSVPAYKVREVA